MPLTETISHLFRQKKESSSSSITWSYDQFRDYLLLMISRGTEFVLPYDQYPQRIQLGKPWHDLLNKMRKESKDGNERLALIGYTEDRKNLYLPKAIGVGNHHMISPEVYKTQAILSQQDGMAGIVGDIHSHPNNFFKHYISSIGGFSSHDLFRLLVPPSIGLTILADNERNFLAFVTKETRILTFHNQPLNQEQYGSYWRNQVWSASMDEENAIAQGHKLVIYSGKPNGELKRETT